jgi:NTE family protein
MESSQTAVVLTGGGARAAYQVGFLRCLANRMPEKSFPVLTGVSAGAINATCMAAHKGDLSDAAVQLTDLWSGLNPDQVFRVDGASLAGNVLRWGLQLVSGGAAAAPRVRGLLDTTPLRRLLRRSLTSADGSITGVARNLDAGRLQALAVSTLDFATGETTTWVQGCQLQSWQRAGRRGVKTRISVDHVMASAALPLVFPAVRLGATWHGDGGIRMSAPLAPAIHLGARRILAISTRYRPSTDQRPEPAVVGYPPPAQVMGVLLNAIFLDALDQDAARLKRINRLLAQRPGAVADGLRPIELLVLRPSLDLGRLAADFEPRLPRAFRFLTRGLGTRETASPDFLSLLMFQRDYLTRLIEVGEADAEARLPEIEEFLGTAT